MEEARLNNAMDNIPRHCFRLVLSAFPGNEGNPTEEAGGGARVFSMSALRLVNVRSIFES